MKDMFRRFHFDPDSLTVQVVIIVSLVVILTAGALGIPSIWLIRSQMERQSWEMVGQGNRTTQALYAAAQRDITNLAVLTAQRPTLHALLQGDDSSALKRYLETLRQGAALDLIIVCKPNGTPLEWAGTFPGPELCISSASGYFLTGEDEPHIWLVDTQPLDTGQTVVVGTALDEAFLSNLKAQTGLEHALLVDGSPVITTLLDDPAGWQASAPGNAEASGRMTLSGEPYLNMRFALDAPDLEHLVALPVSETVAAQRRLTQILAVGLMGVILLGSVLGVLLSGRILRPLAELRHTAAAFRNGDLVTPVRVHTRVPEVAVVAYALEDARIALRHSVNQLRKEKEWIEHLLEAIVEGIVTFDQQGRITFFSRGAEQITGVAQEQALGRYCDEIFPTPPESPRFTEQIPAPGRRQKIVVSLRSGRQATLSVTGARLAPPQAGKPNGALVLRDVSDEDAVRHLLGDFLANITHEFRTPLSALAASIELLLEQLSDLSVDEINELLDSLHLGIVNLQTLIDNLLEGASIEAGRFRVYPRTTSLEEIVEDAVHTMRPLFDKYEQVLHVQLPEALPAVQADPRRTSQALVNLLANALKYGATGGEVTLTAEMWQENSLRVLVADRGPGIPQERLPDMFTRFVRLSQEGEKPEYGTGLGLTVVKAIVEAQGGQVGVTSREGGGAVFWFTVPLAVEEIKQ